MKKARELREGDALLYMDSAGVRGVTVEKVRVAVLVTDGHGGRKAIFLPLDEEVPIQEEAR